MIQRRTRNHPSSAGRTRKSVLRGKPTKDETRRIISRFQHSAQTWRAFFNGLAPEERRTFEAEIDLDAKYSDLLEEASPPDSALESIRKDLAQGFDPWAAHAVAQLCVDFYLRKRLEERKGAAQRNTGPRASRYSAEHASWIKAAQRAVLDKKMRTRAVRERVAADAIQALKTRATRRVISAFVSKHWPEIDY